MIGPRRLVAGLLRAMLISHSEVKDTAGLLIATSVALSRLTWTAPAAADRSRAFTHHAPTAADRTRAFTHHAPAAAYRTRTLTHQYP